MKDKAKGDKKVKNMVNLTATGNSFILKMRKKITRQKKISIKSCKLKNKFITLQSLKG